MLTDDYAWLREKTNPRVVGYLEAENAYAEAMTVAQKPFAEKLYQETLSHIQQSDPTVPYRRHGYWYYSRTEDGKQYTILCRKKETLAAPEEVMLDVNALAQGEKFMSLDGFQVSDDSSLLAYTTDNVGFRQYRLHVKDLRTGKLLPGKAGHSVRFPEPAYALSAAINAEFDSDSYRYSYQSPITPDSTFAYDVKKQTSTLLKQQEVPDGYDKKNYTVERLFVPAKDGAGIPVTVVYRTGTFKRGENSLYVYGYGSYGYAIDDIFSVSRLPLLDRGVVVCTAHIRGGGELGTDPTTIDGWPRSFISRGPAKPIGNG